MRASVDIRRYGCALVAGACGLAAWWAAAPAAPAASSATVVTVEVPSATTLDPAGCLPGVAGATELGIVLPGDTAIATDDCTVVFGSSNDTASLQLVQADAAGVAMWAPPRDDTLDPAFGSAGTRTWNNANSNDNGIVRAIPASDGDILVTGEVNSNDRTTIRLRADGSTRWERVTDRCGTSDEQAQAVAEGPDGSVVTVGNCDNGSQVFEFERLLANGTVDTSFSATGRVRVDPWAGEDDARAVAADSQSRIVAGGGRNSGAQSQLVRLAVDGSLDPDFDTDGKWSLDIGSGNESITDVAVTSNDGVVAVGYADVAGTYMATIVHLRADGSPYPGFGAGGVVTLAQGAGNTYADRIAIGRDGDLLVALRASNGTDTDAAVIRVDPTTGVPDPGFGSGGVTLLDGGHGGDGPVSIWEADDGAINVGIRATGASGRDYGLARLHADGTPDQTLDADGVLLHAFDMSGTNDDVLVGAGPGEDGRVWLMGYAAVSSLSPDYAVAQLDSGRVADWAGGWATGSSVFAACLQTLSGAAADWTLAGAGACTGASDASWNTVPTSASAVARTSTTGDSGTATLRFGVRMATDQRPGGYVAPIAFEVTAPAP